MVTVELRIPQPVRLLERPLDLRSLDSEHRVAGQQLSGRLRRRRPPLPSFDLAALDEGPLGTQVGTTTESTEVLVEGRAA